MKLYDTPEKKVVDLNLDKSKPIKLYTCGPTVYDFPHIGNWYTFIRYDLLARTLRASGYDVNWVMNITDVGHLVSDADSGEDKLEKGAKREGKSAWEVAKTYTNYFFNGLERLNFSKVSQLPRATDYIQEQIALISLLEKGGYSYETSDGVYFDTSEFPGYSDFAHLNLEGQKGGERVKTNGEKRHEADFALWKFSPKGQKRDMEWESPWGTGFPGWHLECSAMIHKLLGEPIDIHAGGVDHIATHHTNEIAQTFAAYNQKLSNYWMHCNHILVDGKKMSKSDGTFITLEDVEAKGYSIDAFRFHVLGGHYRSQSEFSWELMEASRSRLMRYYATADLIFQPEEKVVDWLDSNTSFNSFKNALSDDLNTPLALSFLSALMAMVEERQLNSRDAAKFCELLIEVDGMLGTRLSGQKDISSDQKETLKQRQLARASKDFGASDKLRQKLKEQGIEVKDTDDGQIWSRLV